MRVDTIYNVCEAWLSSTSLLRSVADAVAVKHKFTKVSS